METNKSLSPHEIVGIFVPFFCEIERAALLLHWFFSIIMVCNKQWEMYDVKQEVIYVFRHGGTCGTVGICFCFIQSHYMYGGPPLKYTKITTRSPQWDIKQETIYIFRPGGTCGTLGICFFLLQSHYTGGPPPTQKSLTRSPTMPKWGIQINYCYQENQNFRQKELSPKFVNNGRCMT